MTQWRISRTPIWFEIGEKVIHKSRPKLTGIVEAMWTDHKMAQEFAQVLWDDGSRDILPTDQLQKYEEFQTQIWHPEPSPRKEFQIRRKLNKNEIDTVELRAVLEAQGFTEEEIKEKIKDLTRAEVYETLEGWKVFETNGRRFVLRGKQLLEE